MPVDPNCVDVWHWAVQYRDGSGLAEFAEDGQDHGFGEVRLADVMAVALLPPSPDSSMPPHVMLIDSAHGQRPIFFRRRLQPIFFDNATGEIVEDAPRQALTATVLGWQRTVRGKNVAHFTCYFDDGSSFATDSRQLLDEQIHVLASQQFSQPA